MDITQLEAQIENGNFEAVKTILTARPELAKAPTSYQISALLLASYYKKQDIANLIASFRNDLNIYEACAVGKIDTVAYLIEQNSALVNEYSTDGFTPLGLACYFGHEKITQLLLLKGADVNLASKNGFNVFPIHSAVAANNYNLTKLLLDQGAYPNVCQKAGLAPLHTAAQLGNIELIILLLEHGAEVRLRTETGSLPADLAAEKGFNEIAAILRDDD